MNNMKKFIFNLSKRYLPIFRFDGILYLKRWNIFRFKNLFTVRIHKFVANDDDCMHDHPWKFLSITLWGSYIEYSPSHFMGKQYYGFGTFKMRPANWVHRIEIINNKPCWTLVISFKDEREWGFVTKSGNWIPNHVYNNSLCDS